MIGTKSTTASWPCQIVRGSKKKPRGISALSEISLCQAMCQSNVICVFALAGVIKFHCLKLRQFKTIAFLKYNFFFLKNYFETSDI